MQGRIVGLRIVPPGVYVNIETQAAVPVDPDVPGSQATEAVRVEAQMEPSLLGFFTWAWGATVNFDVDANGMLTSISTV